MMPWADGQVSRKRTDRPQGPSGRGRGWDRLPRPRQLEKKPPVCQAGRLSRPPAGGRRAVGSSPPPWGRPAGVTRARGQPRSLRPGGRQPRPGRPSASSDGGRMAGSSLHSRLTQWQRHPRCCSRRERRAQPSLIRPSVAPFIHSSGGLRAPTLYPPLRRSPGRHGRRSRVSVSSPRTFRPVLPPE